MRELTQAEARRCVLAAQGFGRPHPAKVTMRHVDDVIGRLAQFQIDTITTVARAHYLPVFSRLGHYDTKLLDRAAGQAPRRLFEYLGHAASMIDINLEPALRFRMAERYSEQLDRGMASIERSHPGLLDRVYNEVVERGPITARDIEYEEERTREHWGWNWSAVRACMDALYGSGKLSCSHRNNQFERAYDLPERVLPDAVQNTLTPSAPESHVILIGRAAQALGVASEACLTDYFRTEKSATRVAIDELISAGDLEPVTVTGWRRPCWRWAAARQPKRIQGAALVNPFDPLIFERKRIKALFDLHYRIEIYIPEPKRQHGYYVFPLLLDEEFAARVDLKADRRAKKLVVKAAFAEPNHETPRDRVTAELAKALRDMASWLGLDDVQALDKGDLAKDLIRVLARS